MYSKTILTVILTLLHSLSAWADVELIDSAKLESMLNDEVVLIDVRREDEWKNSGVIEHSHTVTFFDQFGGFDADRWLAEVMPLLQSDQPVVLICHSGVRSSWVAKWLDDNTEVEQIYDATEGVAGWVGQGKPTMKYKQ